MLNLLTKTSQTQTSDFDHGAAPGESLSVFSNFINVNHPALLLVNRKTDKQTAVTENSAVADTGTDY